MFAPLRRGLIRPRRGWLIPNGTPRLDQYNPLAAGLIACYLPGSASHYPMGASGQIELDNLVRFPAVNNSLNFLLQQGGAPIVPGRFGAMAAPSGNAGFWAASNTSYQNPKTAFTLLWFGVLSASSNYGQMMGITWQTGQVGAPYVCCNMQTQGSGSNQVGVYWNYGASSAGINITNAALFGVPVVFVGSVNQSVANFYANGQSIGSSAGIAGTINYSGSDYMFFTGTAGGTCYHQGFLGMMWNRALNPGEVSRLSQNLTEFMIYPQDMVRAGGIVQASKTANGLGFFF